MPQSNGTHVDVFQSCSACGNRHIEEVLPEDDFHEKFKKVAGPCLKCGNKGIWDRGYVSFGSGSATPLVPVHENVKEKEKD